LILRPVSPVDLFSFSAQGPFLKTTPAFFLQKIA